MSNKENRVKKHRKGKAGKIIRTVISAILAVVIVVAMVAANTILPANARMVNSMLGYKQSVDNSGVDASGVNLNYNEANFSEDEIAEAEKDLDLRMSGEGIVLLQNDDAVLPYDESTTFSFFGANSDSFAAGAGMLSMLSGGRPDEVKSLKQGFEAAGFGVNNELWKFYTEGAGKEYGLGAGSISFGDAEDFSINECPLSILTENEALVNSFEGTIPVFILRRVAGEGRDMPRSMYNHTTIAEDQVKSYLEPDSLEMEILRYLNDNFDEVALLVNSNAALELDWVADFPNIKSIVYTPALGTYGLQALAEIYAGKINPSGRTVDTFAANALTSPAAQNFGSFQYYTEEGQPTKYNYISYKEGIYVGYKYYETRYEDVILNQGNAGEYDYSSEVVYPFGYGLSYTSFDWSNYNISWDGTECTASLTVTNTGDEAGKEVVQVYIQSPYTEYDKQNLIEKPSVQLTGYAKTKELAPGESEDVTITFDQEQLKSYDFTGAGTYILEPGTYYITAASNAHAAINNIITAKDPSLADRMTSSGDAALVTVYEPVLDDIDAATYSVDSLTGTEIVNQFAEAQGDLQYLSRQDWTGTFPDVDGQVSDVISTWGNQINGTDEQGNPASYLYYKTANADLISKLDSFDSLSPVDRSEVSSNIVFGADNDLALIEMRGLDFNDPLWDKLLDQLTLDDYQQMITQAGYGTPALESVQKPFSVDADTASGLIYGGTGMFFPSMMVLAQTWNTDLALEYGEMIGSEALIGGADGWYAPSMNIHRTPFSGRNGEYYSEDGFLSGSIASASVYGAASKGMYTYVKHFAVNDQENHRGDRDGQFGLTTWANEQSIREIYLKPFEMCAKAGNVELNYVQKSEEGVYENATREIPALQGVMTAFNRIGYTWTGGSYPLITGVLRNEWGFNGFIITDNANTGVFMDAYQMIEAGADGKLTFLPESARYEFGGTDEAEYYYGRQAMHRMLYTIANSKAMNQAMPGSKFVEGLQIVSIVRIAINSVGSLLLILMGFLTWRRFRRGKDAVMTEVTENVNLNV